MAATCLIKKKTDNHSVDGTETAADSGLRTLDRTHWLPVHTQVTWPILTVWTQSTNQIAGRDGMSQRQCHLPLVVTRNLRA